MNAMTKTVAVLCYRCGYRFRRHRTEMLKANRKRCPKCKIGSVYYLSKGA